MGGDTGSDQRGQGSHPALWEKLMGEQVVYVLHSLSTDSEDVGAFVVESKRRHFVCWLFCIMWL